MVEEGRSGPLAWFGYERDTAETRSYPYYIHTSPDFMHAYAHITDTSQSLLPEVGFE